LKEDAVAVAYPNGDWSFALAAAAGEKGYCLGLTEGARHARFVDDPLAISRIVVGARDTAAALAARLAGRNGCAG
jgi:hypothetical protein